MTPLSPQAVRPANRDDRERPRRGATVCAFIDMHTKWLLGQLRAALHGDYGPGLMKNAHEFIVVRRPGILGLVVVFSCLGMTLSAAAQAAAGDLDPTFATDGLQNTDIGPGPSSATAVARQADGKIVAVGRSTGREFDAFSIARLNADGSQDLTFSG